MRKIGLLIYILIVNINPLWAEELNATEINWNYAVKELNIAVKSKNTESRKIAYNKLTQIAKTKKPLALFQSTIKQTNIEPLTKQMVIDVFGGIKRSVSGEELNNFIQIMLPDVLEKKQDKVTRGMLLRRLTGAAQILEDKNELSQKTKMEIISSLHSTLDDELEDLQIRGNSIYDLARFKDPLVKSTAINIINSQDKKSSFSPLFLSSIAALGVIGEQEASSLIIKVLNETGNEKTFGICSYALIRIGGDIAVQALIDANNRFGTFDVRSSLWYRSKEFTSIIKGEQKGNILLALKAAAICHPPEIEEALIYLMSSKNIDVRKEAALTSLEYLPNGKLIDAAKKMTKEEVPQGYLPYLIEVENKTIYPTFKKGQNIISPPLPKIRNQNGEIIE